MNRSRLAPVGRRVARAQALTVAGCAPTATAMSLVPTPSLRTRRTSSANAVIAMSMPPLTISA
jgi:N-acetyl-gamma-glutamylphosphate reductase